MAASLRTAYPGAVLFDLLTALLDSWTVWNAAAGSADAGRRWRATYLQLTYGCGRYVPYEELVRRAAAETGVAASAADALDAHWHELPPWRGAVEVLQRLQPHCRLAVVTNCSARLGQQAARRLGIAWDAVVTAEDAGYYKPHPRPYQLALERLEVESTDAAFVAGSGYDLFGTSRVGLRTYWHNRVGLAPPVQAPVPEITSPGLDDLPHWLQSFHARPPSLPSPLNAP